jgi:hypothetical protein
VNYEVCLRSTFYKRIGASVANDGTSWTFIFPNTPHYGGLWEATDESVKHDLKRALHAHTLTFREFSTALAEIEACLNSRQLCPLTSDPKDLNVLTPARIKFYFERKYQGTDIVDIDNIELS